MTDLGRLKKVELRDIWKTEDRDFTPWLAGEDNMTILSDALGMDLEVEAQEQKVGPFRADILCKDTHDSSWVLIENQLERTDHTHLGQLLTYAAGLEAVTIVWIASRFTDEHRAALDWLNDHTDDKLRFFGLEVELWKIGESMAAPKFNIVSKPNEWTRSISRASSRIESEAVTEYKQMKLEYWTKFKEALHGHHNLRPRKPFPQHWYDFSIGRSGMHLTTTINSRDNQLTTEVYLNDENAKAFFHLLLPHRESIEAELGFKLNWDELPERKACRIFRLKKNVDVTDRKTWSESRQWQIKNLEALYDAFHPYLMKLNPDDWTNEMDL